MINANKERLSAFYHSQIEYVVPFYQRSYVWDEDNWESLWEGIKRVYDRTRENPVALSEHFIGTLITKQNPAVRVGENRNDVIDGQQRLTSIAILFRAMMNVCHGDLPNLKRLLENCLFFEDAQGAKHLRIIHSRVDTEYFNVIMNDGDIDALPNQEHKMIRALDFFEDKLEELNDEDLNHLLQVVLHNVPVVSMLLAAEDDEQVIFDTINSLGVKLTTAELLKNYIFKERQLQALYESDWEPVFEASEEQMDFWGKSKTAGRVIRSNIEVLLYCYLVGKTLKEVKLEELFKEYKGWLAEKTTAQRKEFLQELKAYAKIYFDLPSDEDIAEINFGESEKRFFHVIENLEITTIYPLVMYIYSKVTNGEERARILELLESYLVRRNVCRLTTKNYNNLFVDILRRIKESAENRNGQPARADLLSILVAFDDDSNMFPDDQVFVYGLNNSALSNKHSKEVLYCLALKQKFTPQSDVRNIGSQSLSVEHMLPKKWREYWMEDDMSPDDMAARDRILKTIGNLTLVTRRLNSAMQNASWEDKKPELRKYSTLPMTVDYLDEEAWNETTIESRAADLYAVAQQVWPRA